MDAEVEPLTSVVISSETGVRYYHQTPLEGSHLKQRSVIRLTVRCLVLLNRIFP